MKARATIILAETIFPFESPTYPNPILDAGATANSNKEIFISGETENTVQRNQYKNGERTKLKNNAIITAFLDVLIFLRLSKETLTIIGYIIKNTMSIIYLERNPGEYL